MQTPPSLPFTSPNLSRRPVLSGALAALTALLAACATTGTGSSVGAAPSPSSDKLVPSQWNAVRILDVPVAPDTGTFIRLDEHGNAGGNTGCNVWSSAFLQDDSSVASPLRFGQATTTRRLCEGVRDQTEKRFLSALPQVRAHSLQGSQLVLLDAAGKEVMRLTRRAA